MKRVGVFVFAFAVSLAIGSFSSSTVYASTLDEILREWQGTERSQGGDQIGAQLEQIGLRYEIIEGGDYKTVVECEAGRTQIVYVAPQTLELGDMKVRHVAAPALVVNDPVNPELMTVLLRHNDNVKVGAWCVVKVENQSVIMFKTYVAADADDETLATVVMAVASTADELEEKLTHKDDL